jgi:hypothetical protein
MVELIRLHMTLDKSLKTVVSPSNFFSLTLVEANDELLAAQKKARNIGWVWGNFTTSIPRICLEEFLRKQSNQHVDVLQDLQVHVDSDFQQKPTFLTPSDINTFLTGVLVLINTTELYEWMDHCGDAASPIVVKLLEGILDTSSDAFGELTFNWIRCHPNASGLGNDPFETFPTEYVDTLRPEAQKEYYTSVWNNDQETLYDEYLEKNLDGLDAGIAISVAMVDASIRSIKDASGSGACEYNADASGESRTVGHHLLSAPLLYYIRGLMTSNSSLLLAILLCSCSLVLVYHHDYYRLR